MMEIFFRTTLMMNNNEILIKNLISYFELNIKLIVLIWQEAFIFDSIPLTIQSTDVHFQLKFSHNRQINLMLKDGRC